MTEKGGSKDKVRERNREGRSQRYREKERRKAKGRRDVCER